MDTIKIGSFLSMLRKEKGLTQQALADIFHVSNKTVSKWECGDAVPEITVLLTIATFYQITVDEILQGERKKAAPFVSEATTKVEPIDKVNHLSKIKTTLTIYSLSSIATYIISILLFILLTAASRIGLAYGLAIPLTIISVTVFFIGITITKNASSSTLEQVEQQSLKQSIFKYIFIFVSLIVLSISFLLLLRSIRFLFHLITFIILAGLTPIYYYYLKHKIFESNVPKIVSFVTKWTALLRPDYLISSVIIVANVYFNPLYHIAHYDSGNVLVEEVTGSFFSLLATRPQLIGLYLSALLLLIGIGLVILSYLKHKPMWLSYLLQAGAVTVAFLVMARQYVIDDQYFSMTYDSVNSFFTSFLPYVAIFLMLAIADLAHHVIVKQIGKFRGSKSSL